MLELLLPEDCALCRRRPAGRHPLCADCAGGLPIAHGVVAPPGVDRCDALLAYDGPAADLVVALKHGRPRLARAVAPALAALASAAIGPAADPPAPRRWTVTWAPTSGARRRARGYDQAELLARATASRLGVPARRLLRRTSSEAQAGRDRSARLVGPAFAPHRAVRGGVLVLDDVLTTGATLGAAARALRGAGAGPVVGLVLAARP